MPSIAIFTAALAAIAVVLAHPGHDITHEVHERAEFMARASTQSLQAKCGKVLKARGYTQRATARRQALASDFRQKRSLVQRSTLTARDVNSSLATDHHSNLAGIELTTPQDSLFGDTSSCLLTAEVTEGPYYVTGEAIRANMSESEPGIDLVLDVQVIDVNTCEPLTNQYVDFWHCNSTGVYQGINANGNGDASDLANINRTALRGIQPTDDEGVVQMATKFPGYYTGRTVHIHVITHGNGTVLPNNTFTGGTNSHVGQLFFDQDLISAVNAVEPYADNTQTLTANTEDGILTQEAATTDPLVEYVYAGDSVEDGIVGWITIGVDSTANTNVTAAANYGAGGGVANTDAGGSFGGGPPPTGSGTLEASTATATTAA